MMTAPLKVVLLKDDVFLPHDLPHDALLAIIVLLCLLKVCPERVRARVRGEGPLGVRGSHGFLPQATGSVECLRRQGGQGRRHQGGQKYTGAPGEGNLEIRGIGGCCFQATKVKLEFSPICILAYVRLQC